MLISARRVGPTGKAIGLDMTDEMLELARANAAEAGVENVEFLKGYLEEMPLADATVDVVISNCVINLSGDKPQVLREAARVLRPGGRFAVSDVIADPDMDAATRADMAAWTGCIAGALTETEFRHALAGAGFETIEIRETHRVHEHAGRGDHPRAQNQRPDNHFIGPPAASAQPAACNTPATLATCGKPDQKDECRGRSAGDARRSGGQRQASESTGHGPRVERTPRQHRGPRSSTLTATEGRRPSAGRARSSPGAPLPASHDALGCSPNAAAGAALLSARDETAHV